MKKRAAAATAATGKTTTTNMWNLDSFVDSTRPYKVRKRCDSVGAKEMHDVKREIENALAHRIGTGHAYYAIPFPSSLPRSMCVCVFGSHSCVPFCTWLCFSHFSQYMRSSDACMLMNTNYSGFVSVCGCTETNTVHQRTERAPRKANVELHFVVGLSKRKKSGEWNS